MRVVLRTAAMSRDYAHGAVSSSDRPGRIHPLSHSIDGPQYTAWSVARDPEWHYYSSSAVAVLWRSRSSGVYFSKSRA